MANSARLKPALYYRVFVEGLPAMEFQNVSGLNLDRDPKHNGFMALKNSLFPLNAEWSAWLTKCIQNSEPLSRAVKVDIFNDQEQQTVAMWEVTDAIAVKCKSDGNDPASAESIEMRYLRMNRLK